MKYINRVITFSFTFLLLLSSSSKAADSAKEIMPSYAGIFTSKIYDQSDIDFPDSYTASSYKEDEETQGIIEERLNQLKTQHIELKCISFLEGQLEQRQYDLDNIKRVLDEAVDESKEHQSSGSWLRTIADTSATGLGWFLGGPIVGGLVGGMTTKLTGTASETVKSDTAKRIAKKSLDAQSKMQEIELIQQEMRRVNMMRSSYIEGITREPENILAMEREYIFKKRFLPPKLQEKIEDAFMETRAITFSHFEKAESFLKRALQVPLEYKDFSSLFIDERALCRAFNDSTFFSKFDPDVRQKLRKVIYDIYLLSKEDSRLERKCYYFWGDPGIGKSCAAREVPVFLHAPFFEMTVRNEEDLSQANMEGTPRSWQGSKVGYLGEALLSTDDEGNTYFSSVLVIHDFDRVFLSSSSTALSFLLHYLDPITEFFRSQYFGCNLNIKKLIIIITGNQRIPDEPKYIALRERLEEIEFGALPQDSCRSTLEDYRDLLLEEVQVPANLLNREINRLVRNGSSSVRMKKFELRNFITSKRLELLDDQESESSDDQELEYASDSDDGREPPRKRKRSGSTKK